MTQVTEKTALIIGATGSFGAHAAIALLKRGWRIRGLTRDPAAAAIKAGASTPIEWFKGDAMSPGDVARASRGVDLIVHAANPPGYRNWKGLAWPMLEATIAAAVSEGARIVLPGNVYNFAPDAGPAIVENAPQSPATRKGAIRVEMEDRLREATRRGAKALILRAGDFFGPAAPNSALAWLVRRRGARVSSVLASGPRDVGHAFAYLPDLAETLGRILERERELADYEVFHFAGHWLESGDALAASIRRVTGQPKMPLRPFPWVLVAALSPFVETFRELLEMRYLSRRPIGLSNRKLVAFLGAEPNTPLDRAVAATLCDMGCLCEDRSGRVEMAAGALAAA
ncbi:MAG TPA: NAD-dependent epimerase/dehydratase family protein [Caulobacteraceae bacterium]